MKVVLFRLILGLFSSGFMGGCCLSAVEGEPAPPALGDAEERRLCDTHTRWVDRIEGEWAVLAGQGGEEQVVALRSLPGALREGEVLRGGLRDVQCGARLRADIRRRLDLP